MTTKIDGEGDTGLLGPGDGAGEPSSIGRKSVLMGMAASVGFVFANAGKTPAAAATVARGISVVDMGATGNGVTDDTVAVRAAIVAAAGGEVYFPSGTYVLDGLLVDTTARLHLDPAATLLAKPNSPVGWMFTFTGTELKIRGGTIDGNKANQTGRPLIIVGQVEQNKVWDVAEIHFTGTVKAVLYPQKFGGLVSVEHCLFTDQAEHTGTGNMPTAIMNIPDGQPGTAGHVRFNHNRAIFNGPPALPGANPGGLFMASSVNNGDVGNMSTFEAIGNYFYGYGQNIGPTDISPFHFYPSWRGARIIGNYFEECSYSAITAKSVTDFVCADNVFVGGAINAQNFSDEGVIGYHPGYHAGSVVRPRAVISGNIIESAGGESTALLQHGISVHGTPTSHGADILLSNNIISGGGVGIQIVDVNDIVISGNIINGGSSAGAGTQAGMTFDLVFGEVLVADNIVTTVNGHGIRAVTSVNTSRFSLRGNKIIHTAPSYYAAVLRGMAFLKLSGNELNSKSVALNVQADGVANKVGHFAYDATNTVVAGLVSIDFLAGVSKATGQLSDAGSPVGVVTAGEIGTIYRQSDGHGDGILWVALGTTNASWTKVLGAANAGSAGANRLLGMTYDPVNAVVGQAAAPAGVLNIGKVLMPGGGAVTKILFQITRAGTGLVSGRCFLGVYSSTGALIGKSANMSTVLAATGTKTVALTVPTAAQTPGAEVFVALLWNGTAGPQLRGIAGTSMANIGITAVADFRFTTAGSGLTAMPTTRPAPVISLTAPWFGVV